MATSHASINANINTAETSRILVVDEDEIQAKLLADILAVDGYDVAVATSGEAAIELHNSYNPDVIIMDVVMHGMDGYQTARQIRGLTPDSFIPIIFVSSLDSGESIVNSLESGGVDCLIKPYDPSILNLKIQTFRKLSNLYKTVKVQRDELAGHARDLESGYIVAENIFNKVMQSDVLKSTAVNCLLSPIAVFNGDILLAAYRPSGELHVMLGDFTGHGISAAIGSIPVSDIFYGMTEKGFSPGEILREIDNKLRKILPRGLFLATCIIEYSHDSKRVAILNAGLPDTIIYNDETQVQTRAGSRNYPLGANDTITDNYNIDIIQLHAGDHILMFTDGVIEAKNASAEQFDMRRILEVIRNNPGADKVKAITRDLQDFVGDKDMSDDLTMIDIDLDAMDSPILAKKVYEYPRPVSGAEWKISYCFGPDVLRQVDPLPSIVQSLMEIQKLQKYKQDVFVILKELFVNALDHGLLGLDSTLKSGLDGFPRYMQERKARMHSLSAGIISIEIIHKASAQGGILDVYIYDSGEGFDVQDCMAELDAGNPIYHGRGIFLVKNICHSLTYNEKGNEVHARYLWAD